MPTLTLQTELQMGSLGFNKSITIPGEGLQPEGPVTLPAAAAGTLGTRTDANTGIVNVAAGHGLVTGDLVDLYWSGGVRYGMSATVNANAITVDGGAGDNLPVTTTVINVGKVYVIEYACKVEIIEMFAVQSSTRTQMDARTDAASLNHQELTADQAYIWTSEDGVDNPFDDGSQTPIDIIRISNGDATQTSSIKLNALKNSIAGL